RLPLYSMYSETIAGVAILRAFGVSSKFLRDMLRCVDTNSNLYYWLWGVNRWLSVRWYISTRLATNRSASMFFGASSWVQSLLWPSSMGAFRLLWLVSRLPSQTR
ncbi:hypothetical protein B0H11DRAFT_1742829, partial [Mycena galericulata]